MDLLVLHGSVFVMFWYFLGLYNSKKIMAKTTLKRTPPPKKKMEKLESTQEFLQKVGALKLVNLPYALERILLDEFSIDPPCHSGCHINPQVAFKLKGRIRPILNDI